MGGRDLTTTGTALLALETSVLSTVIGKFAHGLYNKDVKLETLKSKDWYACKSIVQAFEIILGVEKYLAAQTAIMQESSKAYDLKLLNQYVTGKLTPSQFSANLAQAHGLKSPPLSDRDRNQGRGRR